jgi:arsenate reductase
VKLKFYAYKNCDTCRKARKHLDGKGVEYELIPIREQPPTKAELETMLSNHGGNIRKLFNTSGGDYKALNMKEKLPNMTDAEAINLLSKNGNLVKRPFAIKGKTGVVGFNVSVWVELFC